MELEPGTALAGFRIDRLLGSGATASVYRAHQTSLQRDVALKVLAPSLAAVPGLAERFRREGVHLARLVHPAIVTVYEAGSDGDRSFIAMQLVEGSTLKERLAAVPVLEPAEVLAVLDRVGGGLDHAHAQGFVHRDIKPANILLDASGRAYLADFGLTKALTDSSASASGELVGTPLYMPPEQSAGRPLDGRADIYALACVAFEGLAGTPPYSGDDIVTLLLAHAADQVPRISVRNPGVPAAADAVFARALAKEPADRHPDVAAFVTDLRGALEPRTEQPTAPAIGRRSLLLAGLGAVALLGGGAAGVALLSSSGSTQPAPPTSTPPSSPQQPAGPAPAAGAAAGSVDRISAGGYHNLVLLKDGSVKAWGDNSGGELGDGSTASQRSRPVTVSGVSGATAVAASVWHGLALAGDKTVRSWGENQWGQLGDGTTTDRVAPVTVPGLTGVTSIATGGFWGTDGRDDGVKYAHSLVVADGVVHAWGTNKDGQLGDGTTTERHAPVVVPGLTAVRSVAAGATHSLALREDGTVWTWGDNGLRGPSGTENTARASRSTPVVVPGVDKAVALATGCFHSVALLADGTVMTWGWNAFGQLGDGTNTDRPAPVVVPGLSGVVSVAAGDRFTIALLDTGEIRSWGANDRGQLGDGSLNDQRNPVQVASVTDAVGISASFLHCLAAHRSGGLSAWGDNSSGQLGDGTKNQQGVPVKVLGFA